PDALRQFGSSSSPSPPFYSLTKSMPLQVHPTNGRKITIPLDIGGFPRSSLLFQSSCFSAHSRSCASKHTTPLFSASSLLSVAQSGCSACLLAWPQKPPSSALATVSSPSAGSFSTSFSCTNSLATRASSKFCSKALWASRRTAVSSSSSSLSASALSLKELPASARQSQS